MTWKSISGDRTRRAPIGDVKLTLYPTGAAYLSARAFSALGAPEYVRFYVGEGVSFALARGSSDDPDARKCTERASGAAVSMASVLSELKLDLSTSLSFAGEKQEIEIENAAGETTTISALVFVPVSTESKSRAKFEVLGATWTLDGNAPAVRVGSVVLTDDDMWAIMGVFLDGSCRLCGDAVDDGQEVCNECMNAEIDAHMITGIICQV